MRQTMFYKTSYKTKTNYINQECFHFQKERPTGKATTKKLKQNYLNALIYKIWKVETRCQYSFEIVKQYCNAFAFLNIIKRYSYATTNTS